MSRRPGSPGGQAQRRRGLTPIIWIALISVSGVLVLTGAHLALGAHSSSSGSSRATRGGGSSGSERVPRLLLQGSRRSSGPGVLQQPVLRPDAEMQVPDGHSSGSSSAAEAGAGDSSGSSAPAAGGLNKDSSGDMAASASAAASAGAAEVAAGSAGVEAAGGEAAAATAEVGAAAEAAPELPKPPPEQLGPGSDLSTFAAAGTHCEVTPQHGKVRGAPPRLKGGGDSRVVLCRCATPSTSVGCSPHVVCLSA